MEGNIYNIEEIFSTIPIIDKDTINLIPYNDLGIFTVEGTNMLAKWVNKKELVASFIAGSLCIYNDYFLGANIFGYYFEEGNRENGTNYMMFMEKIEGTVFNDIRSKEQYEEYISNALHFQLYNCGIYHKDFHSHNIIIDNSERIRIIDYDPVLIGEEIPDDKTEIFKSNMYRIFRKEKYEPEWRRKMIEDQKARQQERLTKLLNKRSTKGGKKRNKTRKTKHKNKRGNKTRKTIRNNKKNIRKTKHKK